MSVEKDRRAELAFRNADEKQAAVTFATTRGFDSLNAYMLWLYRQDHKANSGERLASLETVRQIALENRVRTAIEGERLGGQDG